MKDKTPPFNSSTFQKFWKKHFIQKKKINSFKFIEGVNFYKSNYLSLYFNVGKNLTKGNTYKINNYEDYKNNTFIVL